ncbi:hypothetical protein SCP_0308320 [Sparassis crispa]|uniref:Uncharacterized protein n=1 Tax=Sparassis crispa TaxID=139825 RepID=A0A401GFY6_9APHY|nr:hypothetical protein SCP_0308320 [Sparassis crispa]GBE81107.1 hypothetical protein SCP_0308320 [Sparassis crispa]
MRAGFVCCSCWDSYAWEIDGEDIADSAYKGFAGVRGVNSAKAARPATEQIDHNNEESLHPRAMVLRTAAAVGLWLLKGMELPCRSQPPHSQSAFHIFVTLCICFIITVPAVGRRFYTQRPHLPPIIIFHHCVTRENLVVTAPQIVGG